MAVENDLVNHPRHYTRWPVEVIEITRHLSFDVGNSVKYILRHGLKGTPRQDIEKALWYLNDIGNGGAGAKVDVDESIFLDEALLFTKNAFSAEPFPQKATFNLMRLLIADSRLEDPLDGYVVNALLALAEGNVRNAIADLTNYLDHLPD